MRFFKAHDLFTKTFNPALVQVSLVKSALSSEAGVQVRRAAWRTKHWVCVSLCFD